MVLECSNNVVVVSWNGTGPDQVQVVTAVDTSGDTVSCNSSGTNCTFNQLSCGDTYTLTVVGHSQSCQSTPSTALSLHTGTHKAPPAHHTPYRFWFYFPGIWDMGGGLLLCLFLSCEALLLFSFEKGFIHLFSSYHHYVSM